VSVRRLRPIALGLAIVVTCVSGFVIVDSIASAGPSDGPSTTSTSRPLEAKPTVETSLFIVGDSLTVGARPWLARDLRRRHVRLVGVNARIGRGVDDGLAVLRKRASSLPPTVMVALGTNDLLASRRQVEEWVRTARQLVGDRRLIWVNLRCNATRSKFLARYRVINDALESAARRYDVEIADWDAWAGARRVRTQQDGVHYSPAAYRLRSSFYAKAVATEP
jgi:lysophospholipase L1-like esterase